MSTDATSSQITDHIVVVIDAQLYRGKYLYGESISLHEL